jgi:hypothetical protein
MGLRPTWAFTADSSRPILNKSSTGALVHVPSACIGVHLPASALNPFLLAPHRILDLFQRSDMLDHSQWCGTEEPIF